MYKLAIPPALQKAVTPILTKKLFYGVAVSCAVGVGLGAWLEPPKAHYGGTTTITLPQDPPNLWGAAPDSISALAYNPPDPSQYQTATVSPPAGVEPVKLAQADESQVAASGDTSRSEADAPQATPVTFATPRPMALPHPAASPQPAPPPAQAQRPQGRDWAAYDARDRYQRDFGEDEDVRDAPPPPRWRGPPERRGGPDEDRPSMQDRRWDFRPDGPAVPLDEDDGGG